MAFTPIPSALLSRRISAQSSTLITLPSPWLASGQGSSSITIGGGPGGRGVSFGPLIRGQYSGGADKLIATAFLDNTLLRSGASRRRTVALTPVVPVAHDQRIERIACGGDRGQPA